MKAQEAVAENVIQLEKENYQLMMEKEILANETDVLTRDRDDLNRTLGVIMTFKNVPVNKFCPDKTCQPCRESWIPFQDHCYLFYDQPPRWKTWTKARTICRNNVADLLVVDSLQEQEFINKHTKYYFDKNHAYWMGLRQNGDKKWIWLDGRNETLGYWIQERVKNTGSCAMTFPGHNATASRGPSGCIMENKLICEHEALIRTPVKTGTKLLHTLLLLVTAAFGIICIVLVSVAIVLRTTSLSSERHMQNAAAQNLQLRQEKNDLERRSKELSRERDGLNWTMEVILQYQTFPVATHCPEKGTG
ncbi:C-type lectin domain family 12 member B-like [Limanda limanda]|uniref:C-type lectin domain family 12 member B-like n=1 Tax=Limanda limanda TaxID=27771 RepID=UPI0029C6B125|nr:C-type lectin domain family 12 member B-like [Limanda limanda]